MLQTTVWEVLDSSRCEAQNATNVRVRTVTAGYAHFLKLYAGEQIDSIPWLTFSDIVRPPIADGTKADFVLLQFSEPSFLRAYFPEGCRRIWINSTGRIHDFGELRYVSYDLAPFTVRVPIGSEIYLHYFGGQQSSGFAAEEWWIRVNGYESVETETVIDRELRIFLAQAPEVEKNWMHFSAVSVEDGTQPAVFTLRVVNQRGISTLPITYRVDGFQEEFTAQHLLGVFTRPVESKHFSGQGRVATVDYTKSPLGRSIALLDPSDSEAQVVQTLRLLKSHQAWLEYLRHDGSTRCVDRHGAVFNDGVYSKHWVMGEWSSRVSPWGSNMNVMVPPSTPATVHGRTNIRYSLVLDKR